MIKQSPYEAAWALALIFFIFVVALMMLAEGRDDFFLLRSEFSSPHPLPLGEGRVRVRKYGGSMSREISDGTDHVTITDRVDEVRNTGLWLGHYAPEWSRAERRIFIPRKLILDSDTDLDEIVQGEEITVVVPRWKARQLELVE